MVLYTCNLYQKVEAVAFAELVCMTPLPSLRCKEDNSAKAKPCEVNVKLQYA